MDDNLDLNFFDFDENLKALTPELELSCSEKEVPVMKIKLHAT